jgi:hypothetical protein
MISLIYPGSVHSSMFHLLCDLSLHFHKHLLLLLLFWVLLIVLLLFFFVMFVVLLLNEHNLLFNSVLLISNLLTLSTNSCIICSLLLSLSFFILQLSLWCLYFADNCENSLLQYLHLFLLVGSLTCMCNVSFCCLLV